MFVDKGRGRVRDRFRIVIVSRHERAVTIIQFV